jgi:hypothetical protein
VSGLVKVDLSEGQVNVRPSTYLVNVDMPEVVARVGIIAGDVGLLDRIKVAAAAATDFADFQARIAAL